MAQSTAGTDIKANWALDTVVKSHTVKVDWNKDGDFSDANEDITARVLSLVIRQSLLGRVAGLPLLGNVPPGTAHLVLQNFDNFFSPDNESSAIQASIADGIYRFPIEIKLGYASETLEQFVGEIESADESESPRGKDAVAKCVDNSIVVRQFKHTTALIVDNRPDQIIGTLLDVPTDTTVTHSQDTGMCQIPYAGLDDENIWEECQLIAAADGGWVYFTKAGAAVFERMTHWLEAAEHTASQATLDTGNAWWLGDSVRWKNVYTDVTVPWAPRLIGGVEVLYEALEPIVLAPDETKTIKAKYDFLAYALIPFDKDIDCAAVTAGMHDIASDLSVTVTGYCKQASIELVNGSSTQAMYVLNLQIRGLPLVGRETHEGSETENAGVLDDNKTFMYPRNFYMQTEVQAARVGGFLRDWLQRPRRLLAWRGPAPCWLEPGDRVHVDHKTATYNPDIDTDAYILDIVQRYATNGMYEMELLLLPVTDLFEYGESDPGYFVIGVSLYKDAASDHLFY